jgi:dethiobiotin synthetase
MKLFITGISTDVGKTITSAIITEALQADYWKPVQAGDLDHSDSHRVASLISNTRTMLHPNSYALNTPASPHLAAEIDGIEISLQQIIEPVTSNEHLVIEAAGGLLVPLNLNDTVADLIQPDYKVIIVSRHYLGSISHTLLTIESLLQRNIVPAGIIFNGDENIATESLILNKTGIPFIGRINNESVLDKSTISRYAALFRSELLNLST